jgi:hypothetical protein
MFQTKAAEKIETHFLCSIMFRSKNRARLSDKVDVYGTACQATDDNIMLRRNDAVCMPG